METPGVRRVGMNLPARLINHQRQHEKKKEAEKRTQSLAIRIHIIMPRRSIRLLIVRDIVDLVLVEEGLVDDPGRVCDDLVHPAAVARGFEAVRCQIHYSFISRMEDAGTHRSA